MSDGSPIEGNPKVLSLDPNRSALTPTEIRNIAGQKTAVFCRKMSTWLIIPHGTHNIAKRNVEEVEERTYRRHGFHTVQYSHYGHETTRRYRIPSNTSSSHLVHENKHPLEKKHQQLESLVSNSTFEKIGHRPHFHEHEYPPDQEAIAHSPPLLPKANFRHGDGFHVANGNFHPEASEGTANAADFNSNFHEFNSRNADNHLDYEIAQGNNKDYATTNERIIDPNLHDRLISKNDYQNNHYSNLHAVPNNQPELENSEFQQYSNNIIKTEFSNENERNQYPSSGVHNPLQILHNTNEVGLNPLPKKHSVSLNQNKNVVEPISSLDIHKLSPNFEVNHGQEFLKPHVQPAEDVHTIFEGFHNLRESDFSSGPDHLYNVPFEPAEFIQKEENRYNKDTNNNIPTRYTNTENINSAEVPSFPDKYTPLPTTTDDYSATSIPLNLNNDSHGGEGRRKLWQTNHGNTRNIILTRPIDSGINLRINDSSISTHKLPLNTQIVSENFHFSAENPSEQAVLNSTYFHRNSQTSNITENSQHSFPIPIASVQENLGPNQIRFQNILRHYKPDEIVINLEKISTERPPNSVSGFQTKPFSISTPPRILSSDFKRDNDIHRQEQILGIYPRGNNLQKNVSSSRRRINNLPKRTRNRSNFHLEQKSSAWPSSNDRNYFSQPSTRSFLHFNEPKRQLSAEFFNQPPRLDTLPPGVSLHPRHPQAPYANMVRTNVLQPLPHQDIPKSFKPHRQRHHRKKDIGVKSCCGKSGLPSACCSRHSGRRINPKLRCCSQHKLHENLKPFGTRQNVIVLPENKIMQTALRDTPALQTHSRNENLGRRTHTMKSNNDRCQKEKMCRTLYESTQQVMVCRNINIEGC